MLPAPGLSGVPGSRAQSAGESCGRQVKVVRLRGSGFSAVELRHRLVTELRGGGRGPTRGSVGFVAGLTGSLCRSALSLVMAGSIIVPPPAASILGAVWR